jgi:hypothetical protein
MNILTKYFPMDCLIGYWFGWVGGIICTTIQAKQIYNLSDLDQTFDLSQY